MWRLAMLPIAMFILVGGTVVPVEADEPKLKIEVVGPDGKPVQGAHVTFSTFGDNKPVKQPVAGEIIVVGAIDTQMRPGKALVMIPKTGSATVVVKTGTYDPNYTLHADKARQASEAGDLDAYNAQALQAREAIDQERANLEDERRVVEQWKAQHYLPDMTAAEAQAAIDQGKAQGVKETSTATRLLTRYKTYLAELEASEAAVKRHEDDFKTLKPPAKKTTMATCPNGEGGLLAGWINSVTGSDFAPACGIDPKRDKDKNRRDKSRDRDHEHD